MEVSRQFSIDSEPAESLNVDQLPDEVPEEKSKKRDERWEFRTYHSRRWGHTLRCKGGSNSKAVKKLTATLKDARASSEVALRRTAVEALLPAASVGNRGALAAQARALGDEEETVRRSALKSLQKAAGGKRSEGGGAVAVALAEALPEFGKVENTAVRRAAANALAKLAPTKDKQVADIAMSWVGDDDPKVRAAATQALGVSGTGRKALKAVTQGLVDVDWRVNRAAVQALEKFAGNAPIGHSSSQKLTAPGSASSKSLLQPDEGTPSRTMSKTSLGFSQPSITKVNTLNSTTSNFSTFSSTLRSTTGNSTMSSNSKSSGKLASVTTPVDALAECCRSRVLYGLPRHQAVTALGKVASSGDKAAILAVADQLTDADTDVRNAAVRALDALAPDDRAAAVRASASQLTSVDYRVRASAGIALATVADQGGETLATSLAAATLDVDDWRSRRGAAAALRRLGELDEGGGREAVLSVLVPRLEHPDWSIRRKAAQALGVVAKGVGDPRALRLLKGLARDPDEEVRVAVVLALPGAAPPKKCREAVDMAVTFSEDANPRIRLAAVLALEELASPERSRSRVAVRAVSKCIKDDVDEVRLAAERVMRSIAPGRRTAVDELAQRLTDPDKEVREAAVQAFGGVGPDIRERSLKRLVPLLRHTDAGIRQAASEAMQIMTNPAEAAAIAAAASTMARFRRRFRKPAGHALYEEDEDDESSVAATNEESETASVPPVDAAATAARSGITDALLAGDLQAATECRDELLMQETIKEDTDTESELSESDTDEDEDEEEDEDDSKHSAAPYY